MNSYRLNRDIEAFAQIGEGLPFPELFGLKIGLKELEDRSKFDQLLFWGKIKCLTGNYFIAMALKFKNEYEFPSKAFFYAKSDFIFRPLPPIIKQFREKVEDFNEPFKGDPEALLWEEPELTEEQKREAEAKALELAKQKELDEENVSITEDEELKEPEAPKKLKEIHRLSFVVRAIENDCAALPVGSLMMMPIHEVRYNPNFVQSDLKEAAKIGNWMHFRAPQSEEKVRMMVCPKTIFRRDFLDPVENDKPRGSWSLQPSFSKDLVTLRNYSWPGFCAFLFLENSNFGYAYIGNGCKNVELGLMV